MPVSHPLSSPHLAQTPPQDVALSALVAWCDQTLQAAAFKDYAPNGLQVAGNPRVAKIVTGVTANLALIEAAIARQADAIFVHHGYFWKGEDPCLTGMKGKRIATLYQHNLSLIAYHLPLDAHTTLGNNIAFAELLGFNTTGALYAEERYPIGNVGECTPMSVEAMLQLLTAKLGRPPQHLAGGPALIRKIGWCTGGAQDMIQQAAAMGCDAYFSGEVSERTFSEAAELGIHYFACGHHATERGGIQRLGAALALQFGIAVEFIDIENPV
jgi:dinuclear metal center YbgI/SA1388 family protein